MEKIEDLNKEYSKYSQAIVKLLSDSLNQGEFFLFRKLEEGGYGIVISRERLEDLHISSSPKMSDLLDMLEK